MHFLIYFNVCCDKIPVKKPLGIYFEKNFVLSEIRSVEIKDMVQAPNVCSHVVYTWEHTEVSAGLSQLFVLMLCYSIPNLWVGPSS